MENTDSTKDRKIERLEKEVEALKNRMKNQTRNVPTQNSIHSVNNQKESDKIRFQLNEQVKDLKVQLKYQQTEYSRLQESSNGKIGELEEKIKRMREIFGQASKNIDGYRSTIADKEVEIKKLRIELEECQIREHKYKSSAELNQQMTEKLNSEVTSSKAYYESEMKQLESRNRQLTVQLEQTKNNYEQYKKRAHMLFEKNNDQKLDDKRIHELEETVQKLQLEKSEHEAELLERQEKEAMLEHDIRKAIDHINELESTQIQLIKEQESKQRMMQDMQEQSARDISMLDEKLESSTKRYQQTLDELQRIKSMKTDSPNTDDSNYNSIHDQQDTIESYENKVHELEQTIQSLHTQLSDKDNEIERLLITTPTSPPVEEVQLDMQDTNETKYEGSDVYSSMSNLLSPFVSSPTPDDRTLLERQVQRLSQLLQENEEKVIALTNQEKLLKDEIRKIDSIERRQNINVEYLKNVFIKFLTSENKQAMVPIIAKLLYLDKAETESIMNSVHT